MSDTHHLTTLEDTSAIASAAGMRITRQLKKVKKLTTKAFCPWRLRFPSLEGLGVGSPYQKLNFQTAFPTLTSFVRGSFPFVQTFA